MTSLIHNVYLSTRHRDPVQYQSASSFTVDLPNVLTNIHSLRVRNFKYIPECVINANNQYMPIAANGGAMSGTIQVPPGDYNQNIADILGIINSYLTAYDVAFVVEPLTQLVQLTFNGPFVTDFFAIANCPLLKLLGFDNGIFLYRSGHSPSVIPSMSLGYNTVAYANRAYKVVNDTDLILRIVGLEAISSIDSVSNRATAVLMSTRTPFAIPYTQQEAVYPLLQVQHRIQVLRVTILNSNGDFYDLNQSDASFIIEFHCTRV